MTYPTVMGLGVQILLVGALLGAGLGKVTRVRHFSATVGAVGVPPELAGAVAAILIVAEVAVGAALALFPGWSASRLAVVVLAGTFAAAGVAALRSGKRIPCGCFGSDSGAILGWRQVGMLPLWLALVGVTWLVEPAWSPGTGLGILAAVLLALALFRMLDLLRLARPTSSVAVSGARWTPAERWVP